MSCPVIPDGEGRILCVDFGDVRMGLARSDPGRCFASPWKVVTYKGTFKRAAHLVIEAAAEGEVVAIVVGMPRSMDGSYTGKAVQVREFVTFLKTLTALPVDVWDERLSTVEATRSMQDAGLRERRIRPKVDKVAAALILQGWLEHAAARTRYEQEDDA
ncbi:MAG: Holliday junction resolvase RuvX [Pseudomonadota bacterium]